jgi:hypothetical protein
MDVDHVVSLGKEKCSLSTYLQGCESHFMCSGKSTSGKSSGGAGTQQTRSARAGLAFPVGRLDRLLKKGHFAKRIGRGAPGTRSSLL